ncbi:MAG: glycerol-3-phosphate dehydrogenase/oxidase [Anaerolineales bacterium]
MIWKKDWRDLAWSQLDRDWDTQHWDTHEWDIIIVGGGITGAGILRQATQAGLRALLVDKDDFASGTSSRSSKLVHGGLRYLKTAQIKLTLESVREREFLLRQGRGLVNQLGFLYAGLKGDKMPGWIFGLGLSAYDIMARQWLHRSYDELDMRELCPPLTTPDLTGGYRYFDAQTDDARLVFRLLREAVNDGALALNYARVESLLQTSDRRTHGVVLCDTSGESDRHAEVKARVVINATGVWADQLRSKGSLAPHRRINQPRRMRPLRGSHLVLPAERLPITRAVTFLHPEDGRPVFALPWEGTTIFGTTDVDHKTELITDPAISEEEFEYLLSSLQQIFPSQELIPEDIISTFSGLRPVIDTGKEDPSKESREHAIWDEDGLITVTGGKLTTFRLMARDALKIARKYLGAIHFDPKLPVLKHLPEQALALLEASSFNPAQRLRLLGRYGPQAAETFAAVPETERGTIASTPYLWAELRQAACCEGVVHLSDLLLRRVRLGLLLPGGGIDLLDRIRGTVQPELGWDDFRWEQEAAAYVQLWQKAYSPQHI